jgi:hypothetical protein
MTVGQTIGTSDILASNVFNSGVIRRIFCNGSGTVSVARVGDLDDNGTTKIFTAYTVAAATILEGEFVAIAGTAGSSPASTAVSVVFEC